MERGQDLLWRYDIDPVLGLENLVWAPLSVNEQHGRAALQAVVDGLEAAEQQGHNPGAIRKKLIQALAKLGMVAAERK